VHRWAKNQLNRPLPTTIHATPKQILKRCLTRAKPCSIAEWLDDSHSARSLESHDHQSTQHFVEQVASAHAGMAPPGDRARDRTNQATNPTVMDHGWIVE